MCSLVIPSVQFVIEIYENKEFYIFPDGTYIYGDGKNEEIYGDFKVLKNGKFIYDYNTNNK